MKSQGQLGRHIVSDPKICHGQPTFRGTRILVADVLDQVADGLAWAAIVEEWHGSLSAEAIAEAVAQAGPSSITRKSRCLGPPPHDEIVSRGST